MQPQAGKSQAHITGGIVSVVGGSLAVVSTFLPWLKASFGGFGFLPDVSINGLSRPHGVIMLLLGLAGLTLGILQLGMKAPTMVRATAIAGLCLGIVVIGVAVLALPFFSSLRGNESVHPGIGGFVAMLGGLILAAGGALLLLAKHIPPPTSSIPPVPPVPPVPPRPPD